MSQLDWLFYMGDLDNELVTEHDTITQDDEFDLMWQEKMHDEARIRGRLSKEREYTILKGHDARA